MPTSKPTRAVILAAGRGEKCWPFGVTQNKAVLPVAARPLIQHTVAALRGCGIEQTTIVIGYRGPQVRHALRQVDGVQYVEVEGVPGTAVHLQQALGQMNPPAAQPVLVLYGDVLYAAQDLQALCLKGEGKARALLQPLGEDDSRDWICAAVAGDRIARILAHPRHDVTHRFAGAFVLTPGFFLPYLQANPGRMSAIEVGQMPPDEAHLEESLHMALQEGHAISVVEAQGPCVDIDRPWHLLQANQTLVRDLTQKLSENTLAPGAEISSQARVEGFVSLGKNSEIGPGCIIKGNLIVGENTKITDGAIIQGACVVGDHTTIQEYCQLMPDTAIGSHCFVGHGAEFGGLMMDRAYSYHYGEYWGVLGTACDLGAATVCGNLRFDDDLTIHRIRGRRERPKSFANAAYLGDYVRTGVNTILMPGVKVGPYSVIGAGTIVNEDIPDKTLAYVEQQVQKRTWGPERYGW